MTTFKGCQCSSRMCDYDIGPVSGYVMMNADLSDQSVEIPWKADAGQHLSGLGDPFRHKAIFALESLAESLRYPVECVPSLNDVDSRCHVSPTVHLDAQTETIQQLRSQLSFFRIHSADENETRWMAMGYSLSLNYILARSGNIQDYIDQMIREEVHFINVQDPSIGARHESRLEYPDAFTDRRGEVESPNHHFFCGVQGEFHDTHLSSRGENAVDYDKSGTVPLYPWDHTSTHSQPQLQFREERLRVL